MIGDMERVGGCQLAVDNTRRYQTRELGEMEALDHWLPSQKLFAFKLRKGQRAKISEHLYNMRKAAVAED